MKRIVEKPKCIIGVDAGGSKTQIVAFTLTGIRIYSVIVGPGSLIYKEQAIQNIDEGISTILSKVKDYEPIYLQMGISGFGSYPRQKELEKEFEEKYHLPTSIENDAILAINSLTKGKMINAILVLAGTGSAIYGISEDKEILIGGWGHLLNEKGSSYSIVQNACLRLISHFEDKVPFDHFDKLLMEKLDLRTVYDLKVFFYQNKKEDIAKHAIWIKDLARTNKIAKSFIRHAGGDLAKQVIKAINYLDIDESILIGLRGGLFKEGKELISSFKAFLLKKGIKFHLEETVEEPINGAFYLAKSILKGE